MGSGGIRIKKVLPETNSYKAFDPNSSFQVKEHNMEKV